MILSPSSTSNYIDVQNGNRVVVILNYQWKNGVSQKDAEDTFNGLLQAWTGKTNFVFSGNPITDLLNAGFLQGSVIQRKVLVNFIVNDLGFSVAYTDYENGTISEKIRNNFDVISGTFTAFFSKAGEIVKDAWDSLKDILGEAKLYFLLFILLLLILYLWTHRKG